MTLRPAPLPQRLLSAFTRRGGLGHEALAAAVVALSALLYYVSPDLLWATLATVVFVLAAWWRLDLGLLVVLAAAPFHRFPKALDLGPLGQAIERTTPLQIGLAEYALWVCVGAWLLGRAFPPPGERTGGASLSRPDWRTWLPPVLLVGVATLSLPFSEHLRVALREYRLVVLEPAVYYLLLVQTLRGRQDVVRFLHALVVLGLAVALYGLYHYFFVGAGEVTGGVRRILAIYQSPNALALFLGRVLPVAFALALAPLASRPHDGASGAAYPGPAEASRPPEVAEATSLRGAPVAALRRLVQRDAAPAQQAGAQLVSLPWLLPTVATVGMLACFYLTFSRGATLGLLAALLFVLFATNRRLGFIALAAVVAIGLGTLPFLPQDRLLAATPVAQRIWVWQAAIAMIRDHPLTGVGLDNFLYYYPSYILPQAAFEPDISHAHNLFLDFWARLGILGLAALVWLQYHFWRMGAGLLSGPLMPHERVVAVALMASMLDFLVHGLIDNSYFLIDLAYLFWLTYGLMAVLFRYTRESAAGTGGVPA